MSMKVTRNTPQQLVVEDTPWLLGLFLAAFILLFVGVGIAITLSGEIFGLIFVLAGGGIGGLCLAVMVERVQVILDRAADTLVIRRRSVFGYAEVRHALADLDRAILEETTGSKGGRLYRPALVLDRGMSAGTHPVVTTYTNTRGPRRLTEAINAWLAEHRSAREVQEDRA